MPPSSSDNHTVADVEDAISVLDDGGWWRLRNAAREKLGDAGAVHGPEDLLNEVFMRLLDGRRRWEREFGFEDQVVIIMRSIASDWRRRDARCACSPTWASSRWGSAPTAPIPGASSRPACVGW